MPNKRPTPEQIIGKLREAEIVLAQGATTAEACRRIAVSEQTDEEVNAFADALIVPDRGQGGQAFR